jgi:putative transposase
MVFKLAQSAQNGWRRSRGYALLKDVIVGVEFVDGIKKAA